MSNRPSRRQQPRTTKEIADTSGHPNRSVASKRLEEANDSLEQLLMVIDCVRKAAEPDYDPPHPTFWAAASTSTK